MKSLEDNPMAGKLGRFLGTQEPTEIKPGGFAAFRWSMPPYWLYSFDYLANFEKWHELSETQKDSASFHPMPDSPYPPDERGVSTIVEEGIFFTLPERIKLFDELIFCHVLYRDKMGYAQEFAMEYMP